MPAQQITWNLADLYESNADALQDLQKVEQDAEQFAADYHGRVGDLEASGLAHALARSEAIEDLLGKVEAFAYLKWASDTRKADNGAFLQKVREVSSRIKQLLLFFELEWLQLPQERTDRLLNSPDLSRYRHHLEVQLLFRRHVLTEPEEKILAEKTVTGIAAWTRYFDELVAGLTFDFRGQALSEQEVLSKLQDSDRSVRRDAALALSQGLNSRLADLAFIFNTVLAEKASEDRLRGFENWLSARNLSNQVSDETVQALVSAVTSRYDLSSRYYALKGRLLGIEPLEDFDRYAPLGDDARSFDWDEAREIVVASYQSFHPVMGETARKFFDSRWIDAAVRPGKRGGAFSHGVVPSAHPYILMNYTGRLRDVQTLAHELGHGIHQYLARKQGVFQASTPLTMAETASVFGEMLAFRTLMDRADKPEIRLSMLMSKIDDTMATVFRQVAMHCFEDSIHQARRTEGELAPDRFGALWLQSQQPMFQQSVKLNDYYSAWWSYIPHFVHSPGYVYAYAFGELLVLSLYQIYAQRGEAFVEKYLQLLEAGGSDWPERLLAALEVDINDPGFWAGGLRAVEELIEEAERLSKS
ncbi:MAG TPA: M3 family oligoendopeptidase [Acidobacteriota bacterium]|nr:M3 family oligoendopeptidase [Acidobacteriota bacterium]